MLNGRVYDAAGAHDVMNMQEAHKSGFVLHEEHDSRYGVLLLLMMMMMMMTMMLQLVVVILVVVDDVSHLKDYEHGDAYAVTHTHTETTIMRR